MREFISERHYSAGYVVRKERISGEDAAFGPAFEMRSAFSSSGDYIGDPKIARFLCVKKGIKPEKRTPHSKVCSIGFCESEQKWYGWSHRAIYGFGVGDVAEHGDLCTFSTVSASWVKEYLAEHPEKDQTIPTGFEAKDLEDAKRMAAAFAESVS